jgi:tRNA-modifying protein YgfZ
MNTLPHLGLLRFSGPDANAFLQGQVSNDTRPLSGGTPVLAAYSTPQGRVVAVLRLLPHSSGIVAILPRDVVQPTLERLRKYVMRSKVTIEDISTTFAVLGLQSDEASQVAALPQPNAAHSYVEQDGVGVAPVGHDPERVWVVGDAAALAAAPRSLSDNAWRLADIRSGLPQVYAATQEQFVAQMLNLDLIDGISFTKGCYTGQEIIARTQHLGRIKRRSFRLGLPESGNWTLGQTVQLADGRSGRLTEIARSDAGFEALAVLNLEAGNSDTGPAEAGQTVATGVAATEMALPYSLK